MSFLFKKICIASDHAGYNLKEIIKNHLINKNVSIFDLGPYENKSVDYPDFGALLANRLKDAVGAVGVAICGSGIGISIAANRHSWIRAALVHDETTARLARQHNDANIIALGERTMGTATALNCVDIFLDTGFEGGRHQRRVDKLTNL